EYELEIAACGGALSQADLVAALPDVNPVFYMDELCIEAGARHGVRAFQGLTAVLLSGACELGARGTVGFTSKRAAPFRLIPAGGGEISADLGDIVVCRYQDHVPIATLLQHLSPDEFLGLLAEQSTP